MGVTGMLCVIEFLADKVPGVDSMWDAVQTVIRIPAGALLGAAALGQMDPVWTAVAGILGGTFAAGAHATKAGSRALINTSPEPFSNWAASLSEDAAVVAGLWAAFFHPWVLFVFLAIFFLFALWLLPKLWRGLRWIFRRLSF
jgi:ABC-type multidrug transport system permease subunit